MPPEQHHTRPERVLIVSADIGEGHNATARAVEQRARTLWPDCDIRRIDTLDVMGRPVGPVARWAYRANIDSTPWLYELAYGALWRHLWFCDRASHFVGWWCGHRLVHITDRYRPDLVVSTYPLGSAGLAWIRRRGGLDAPVATIIPDFAPHPFWVRPEIDMHLVVSEPSVRALRKARPEARATVSPLPVVAAFAPTDRAAARRNLGLPTDRSIVVISGGSFGFGTVERATAAALRASAEACVVVTCGRNEALRGRLAGWGEPPHRLVALGWTTQMPALLAAADVVITNGAGATALEAVASGRAVLTFAPIAGHGRANAALMEQAALTRVCPDEAALVGGLQELLRRPELLADAESRTLAHIGSGDLAREIAALPDMPRPHGGGRLSAADAFFVHVASDRVPQQVGAIMMLDTEHPPGPPEEMASQLASRIAERTPMLTMLRRRLLRRPGRWPRWLPVDEVEPARHIGVRTVGADGVGCWSAAVREFFMAPVPQDRPPWRVQVLRDATTGRTALLAALHHALGDGLAVTATLVGLLADRPGPQPPPPEPDRGAGDLRARTVRARQMLRGLVSLASTGSVSFAAGNHSTPARGYGLVELPAGQVRAAARTYRVSTTVLLLALLGEALHRTGGGPADAPGGWVRVMAPRTVRAVRRAGDGGNHTAAVSLRVPVGPMAWERRLAAVGDALDRMERTGQPAAARAVVSAIGHLPARVHAVLAPLLYRRQFFDLLASVMPGPRRAHHVMGARVRTVHPLLPLAEGVGLAVGFLSWGETIGVGVTADTGLQPDAERLAALLVRVAEDVLGVASANPPAPQAGITERPVA